MPNNKKDWQQLDNGASDEKEYLKEIEGICAFVGESLTQSSKKKKVKPSPSTEFEPLLPVRLQLIDELASHIQKLKEAFADQSSSNAAEFAPQVRKGPSKRSPRTAVRALKV